MAREEIELKPISTAAPVVPVQTDDEEKEALPMQDEGYWAWASAIWVTILSLPLLLFPRFILFLATPQRHSDHRDNLTELENFLTTHLAILLLCLAITLILSIPSPSPIPSPAYRPHVPQMHPLLVPMTSGLLLSAFIAFNTSRLRIGPLGVLVATGNGLCGLWGLWVIVFGGGGHFSKTTGADKRTSAFIFGNRSSASQIKKRRKEARQEEVKNDKKRS